MMVSGTMADRWLRSAVVARRSAPGMSRRLRRMFAKAVAWSTCNKSKSAAGMNFSLVGVRIFVRETWPVLTSTLRNEDVELV